MNARLTHISLSKRAGVSLPTRVASKRNTVARVSPEETQLIICSSTALWYVYVIFLEEYLHIQLVGVLFKPIDQAT